MARMTLEELTRQLSLVYGEGLRCVAVYGSAARGEQIAKRSDLNVLVLVDDVDMRHLRQEAAVSRSWQEGGNPPPLTLTLAEWRGSADIFPIEFADILAYHKVVHGSLPVEGIRVHREHLRLQLEHEARSKVLRLRHSVLASGADARALADVLANSSSAMMVLLRAALRLAGDTPPADSLAMLDRVNTKLVIDAAIFRRVLLHARGEEKIRGDAAVQAMDEYLDAASALAKWVDQAQGEGTALSAER